MTQGAWTLSGVEPDKDIVAVVFSRVQPYDQNQLGFRFQELVYRSLDRRCSGTSCFGEGPDECRMNTSR